jgi:hypothetical protein
MPASSTRTSTSSTSSKNQIIEMLKADHKKVKKAFKDFEKLDPQEDPDTCQSIVEQTCADLEVHSELEEQIFYPAARGALKEADLVDEAEVEHMTTKVLIEQLKGMDTEDEKFAATFKVLGEYINHHVKEEENEMFKQLTRPGVDWDDVLEQMQTHRAQLLEEHGMPAEDEGQTRTASPRSAPSRHAASSSRDDARPQAASGKTRSSNKD